MRLWHPNTLFYSHFCNGIQIKLYLTHIWVKCDCDCCVTFGMTPTKVEQRGKDIGMLLNIRGAEHRSIDCLLYFWKHDETGSIVDRERSCIPVSVVIGKLLNAIKWRVWRYPERSIRYIALKLQCSEKSVINAIKDMGIKSCGLSRALVKRKNDTAGCKAILNLLKMICRSGEGFHQWEYFQS